MQLETREWCDREPISTVGVRNLQGVLRSENLSRENWDFHAADNSVTWVT